LYLFIAFIAYIIDAIFGEFKRIKHPIILIGDYITLFEKIFYKDSKFRGMILTLTLISIVWAISHTFATIFNEIILGVLASMFLAHKMLHDSVYEAILSNNKREKLSYLVSRDTEDLSNSEMNKALVETYGENLSDGVIAPLFYLIIFGFEGIVIYKAINTLDSMVGYKNQKYINYGYFSAKLDDIANLIPSRLTALIIMLLGQNFEFKKLYNQAKKHQSPNAGYPITAIAIINNLSLGGETSYHGKMIKKPYFGNGKKEILDKDVFKVLKIRRKIDFVVVFGIIFSMLLTV